MQRKDAENPVPQGELGRHPFLLDEIVFFFLVFAVIFWLTLSPLLSIAVALVITVVIYYISGMNKYASPLNAKKFYYKLPEDLKQKTGSFSYNILIAALLLIAFLLILLHITFGYLLFIVVAFLPMILASRETEENRIGLKKWIEANVRCPECNGKVEFVGSHISWGGRRYIVKCSHCDKKSEFLRRADTLTLSGFYELPNLWTFLLLVIALVIILFTLFEFHLSGKL